MDIQGCRFIALIDTGSVRSYIGDAVVKHCRNLDLQFLPCTTPSVQLANGLTVHIEGGHCLDFTITDVHFSEFVLYLPDLTADVVLGMDILSRKDFTINLMTGTVYLNNTVVSRSPPPQTCSPIGITAFTPTSKEEVCRKHIRDIKLPKSSEIKRTTKLLGHRIRQPLPGPATEAEPQELCAVETAPTCSCYRQITAKMEKNPEAHSDYDIQKEKPPSPKPDGQGRRMEVATGINPISASTYTWEDTVLSSLSSFTGAVRFQDLTAKLKPRETPISDPAEQETVRQSMTVRTRRLAKNQPIRLPVQQRSLCWRCGYQGHSRQNCDRPSRIFCSRCGICGILSRECPCPSVTPARPVSRARSSAAVQGIPPLGSTVSRLSSPFRPSPQYHLPWRPV